MAGNNSEFIIIKDVLVRYKGNSSFVKIPHGVTGIGAQAFYYNDKIQSVIIPETVISIDDQAFSHCEQLRVIELPNGLKRIGHEAFSHCNSLQAVDLPISIDRIESGAFYYCWRLDEIYLPGSISQISSRAFADTAIEEIEIPDRVTCIDSEAFSGCSKLKRVVLPENLKSVGWRTFYNCRELTDITFPPTLCDIASEAFDGCKGIIGGNGFVIINNELSYYYGNDRVIRIPEGVKRINGKVFYQNRRIAKVILPDSLTSIGPVAFGECINLRDINISPRITELERNAFIDCRKLADENGFVVFNKVLFEYYGHSSRVEIPEGVETIGSCAFGGMDSYELEEVVIPESVKIIEKDAFSYCGNLRKVVLPETMERIEDSAFNGCGSLKSIRIPEGVETLSWDTLQYCRKLEEINLPKSLKKIEFGAISECASLKKIDIPEGVEKIGGRQFDGCDTLREISIPTTVTMFEDCDLKGVQLNFNKLGRCIKVILQHRWDARDEKLLWEMLNDPSAETFNSIKTTDYKVALAERLYPEYEEYGPYLKRNIIKAIKDAVQFGDSELLGSLKRMNLIEPDRFDEELLIAQEENRAKVENACNSAERDINNENIINTTWLKGLEADLERMSRYRDTSNLLKACSERIALLDERRKKEKYAKAINTMNEYGGMSGLYIQHAIKDFYDIRDYKDADEMIKECKRRLEAIRDENKEKAYQKAVEKYDNYDGTNREDLESAIDAFEILAGYKDSEKRLADYYKKFWDVDI